MSAKLKATGSIQSSTPPPSTGIVVGGQVQTTDVVNPRATPAGALVGGTQAKGTIGKVVAGPTPMPGKPSILDGWAGNWWQIDFPSNPDGWVGEIVLAAYTPPAAVKPTYTKWDTKMQAFILTGAAPAQSPAQLTAWLNANPPTPD